MLALPKITSTIAFIVAFPSVVLGEFSTDDPCLRAESAIVILRKNAKSGNFSVLPHRMEPGEALSLPGVQFRKLEEEHAKYGTFLRRQVSSIPGIVATPVDEQVPRWLDGDGDWNSSSTFDSSDELYYAWECSCHDAPMPTVYCPLDINTCLRPINWDENIIPGCRNLPKAYDFRRYSFQVMMVWFFALLVALLTSRFGATVFGFFVSKCFPVWNERAVDRLLERHPDQVQHMIRQYLIREHRALLESRGQEGVRSDPSTTIPAREHTPAEILGNEPKDCPKSLVLQTKRYRSSSSSPAQEQVDVSSETDEVQCAICFLSFEDGDKVGSLKCNHLFHSDCLKMWLKRRNACPLCQVKEIAMPRYEASMSDTESSSAHTDDNITNTSSLNVPSS